MLKLALIGYGKMGRAIHEMVTADFSDQFEVSLIVDADHLEDFTAERLTACDVAIEFTGPEAAEANIRFVLDCGVPCVSGSTGWTKGLKAMQLYAIEHDRTFLYAPNFSIGVNLFFEFNRQMALLMDRHPSYDVRMEETHHTEKRDSPSGTALFATFDILHRLHRKDGWKNRESSNKATLEIISKREPDVPGTHVVRYFNTIDEIELKHTAHSRDGFASGALMAAAWIVGKTGAYSMSDVLGFDPT